MITLSKYALAVLLAVFSSLVVAQTHYEKIEVGTVLQTGITLGMFSKPIPLPEGDWLVVNKRVNDYPLTGGSRSSFPAVSLTLKNNSPAAGPIFAIVMWFTPDAISINWGNRKCESNNPKILVDDFGFNADSMLYACANITSIEKFKNAVATTAERSNKWEKDNLTALSAYADDVADNAFRVDISGNRFRGKALAFTFFIKREKDVATDPAYTAYIQDWTHATGLSLLKVLENSTATFSQPTPYIAQPAK
jgi:hypothetical protein